MDARIDHLDWDGVIDRVEQWREAAAAPTLAIKQACATVITVNPVGYYLQPDAGVVAVAAKSEDSDYYHCKAAANRAVGRDNVLAVPLSDAEAASGLWVKVAYSPTVRRAGELLNFLPGKYPGGIPNAPSPLAAMLTSALVGGGLGYTGGRLAEHALPASWHKGRLRKTLGVIGAMSGAGMALPWMIANHMTGDGMLSPKPLNAPIDGQPTTDPASYIPANFAGKTAEDMPALGSMRRIAIKYVIKQAFESGSAFSIGQPRPPARTPMDVNIDSMGRTLWDTGAPPSLAATAMGTLYAAQQMPDPNAQQGYATGHQLGQLAMNAGKDYLTGALVGAVLNRTIGFPISAHTAGMGGAILGIIGATIPKLFG